MSRLVLVVAVALLPGCKKKEPDKSSATEEAAKKAKGKPAPKKVTANAVAAEVQAEMGRWLESQNKGEVDGYKALYHPKFFKGVKRTSSGKVVRLEYSDWLADRGRMFKKPMTVAMEGPAISTWLDKGSKLKSGVSSVRFVQRWKNDSYADHGVKVVRWWRDPAGKQWLVYEDLLNAEKGWDDEIASDVAKADIGALADDAAALAAWKRLAPTGDSYRAVLASIPDAAAPAMARALIAGGGFACAKYVEADGCGQDVSEYEPLDATADFNDPCLRRRLAEWALDEIDDKQLAGLGAQLAEMMSGPRDELTDAALDKALATSAELAGEVLAAAGGDDVDAVDAALDAITDVALLEKVWADDKVTAVGERLAGLLAANGPSAAVLLEIVAVEEIDVVVRSTLLDDLSIADPPGLAKVLVGLVDDPDCGLSMSAVELLADRGDKSHLPRRADIAGDGDAATFLCQLLESNSSYASNEVGKYFAKDATYTETIENDYYGDEDEESEPEPEPEPEPLDASLFANLDPDPFEDNDTTISWSKGPDGKPVITAVERTVHVGCGC